MGGMGIFYLLPHQLLKFPNISYNTLRKQKTVLCSLGFLRSNFKAIRFLKNCYLLSISNLIFLLQGIIIPKAFITLFNQKDLLAL